MSVHTIIHPKHGETQTLTTMQDDVHWENANSVRLSFGDNDITVFHLDDITADLLHLVASMTVKERTDLLDFHKGLKAVKEGLNKSKEVLA